MDDIRFYASVLLRRLPWILIIFMVITACAVMVAISLPPAYVSQMRLVVESPQIPEELAASTVRTPALEQLQIIEQRLLTRENMLDIARRIDVFPEITQMSPDEIVAGMRSRTSIRTTSGRGRATLMTVTFEAENPNKAAGVLNEYLTLIQEFDAEIRRGRAGETLEFFSQEVTRLGEEIDAQSAEIIAFKQASADALPESLEFRMSQRSEMAEQMLRTQQEIARLENQRQRLVQIFEATSQPTLDISGSPVRQLSANEQVLDGLELELSGLLITFSPENPRVKLLQARIETLKVEIEAEKEAALVQVPEDTEVDTPERPQTQGEMTLDIQLSEIDSEIDILERQIAGLQRDMGLLDDTIARTPEVAISLSEMERAQDILVTQYNQAEDRLAKAQTGDLIESRSRGQRISVIEQPNIPDSPTKPNRTLIAGAGGMVGIGAGLGLFVLLELLNSSIRRPEDLISRLGVTPFATIPYIRTRRQVFWQRTLKISLLLAIVIGVPAAIYAVHIYYLPLDLVAEKVMDRLGVRL